MSEYTKYGYLICVNKPVKFRIIKVPGEVILNYNKKVEFISNNNTDYIKIINILNNKYKIRKNQLRILLNN